MFSVLYRQVVEWIPEGARVLDLGTGDGKLLERLVREKGVEGEGVEKDPEMLARCIERGLVVHQGDILEGLDQYGDGAFDYILLLGTFQELEGLWEVIRESFRVGRRVVISYHNFANWKIRSDFLWSGRTPVARFTTQKWYASPNRHLFSIDDFQDLCDEFGITEVKSAYFNVRGKLSFMPNLRAEQALSLLSADDMKVEKEAATEEP